MSTKVKRKVTVENTKENSDHPRRPSVFERLGPGAVTVPSQSQDRAPRNDQNVKCLQWQRSGSCSFGSACRYQHEPFPSSSRRSKAEKDIDEKDLRHKMRNKRDEPKKSKTGSVSPKRKESKRSRSRSRKGDHESKIKSTVVVTRPRSPAAFQAETSEKDKKKTEGSYEDDSDDWPMDAAQLDYKEELTLERKRQQLQRELELELQKERMLNENVSFSESSSSSSSSDSGSISSSSDSTSSSSDEDSDESSSSQSSSTSSSTSQAPVKKKYKKPLSKKEPVRETSHKKPLDDYDKIKSSRAVKSGWRPRSPASPEVLHKKGRDKKNTSPAPVFSPKRRSGHETSLKAPPAQSGRKGPRTPSPSPVNRKQRQWGQSSSTDSRSADARRNRSKRHHKKKKEISKVERNRMDYASTPPPGLSSPNRTALQPHMAKKNHQRDDSRLRVHHKGGEQSPLLLPRIGGQSNSPSTRHGSHYSEVDHFSEKQGQLKAHGRKSDDISQSRSRRINSKERPVKHSRMSPLGKDSRRISLSPVRDKYETDSLSKRMYSSPLSLLDKDEKGRRNSSLSPPRRTKDIKDRRKGQNDSEKRRDNRDISPRNHDNRRDNQYRGNDSHRKEDTREVKKTRDDKIKDRGPKDRNLDHDSWADDPKKNIRVSDSRRPVDPPLAQSLRGDRSRDRERDRKKGKEREPLMRPVDEMERERQRLSPAIGRVPPDLHSHHAMRDDVSRGRIYEPDIPPYERDAAYGYVPHREPVYLDEHALPPEYEADLRVPPLYPPPDPGDYAPPGYPESRYRRESALKAVAPVPHIERIGVYGTRDISPLDPRDPVGLPVREEDYLADLPMDDRRPYDERWSRTRPVRDEWDPYAALPPAPLPPHVVASLDEDRYGMPRRRRASPPDWVMLRGEEREIPLSREPRSRSPPHRRGDDVGPPSRGSWGDHPDRHNNRNNDTRQDVQSKSNTIQDDRKNRNNRRDRRDRSKRSDELSIEAKPTIQKEKTALKRPHSSSPGRKDVKKRKEEPVAAESAPVDKSSTSKKSKEDSKTETKSSSASRKIKSEPASPKPEVTIKVEKSEAPEKKDTTRNTSKREGEEKRKPNSGGKAPGDDNFSDWSDGDDDLLNRDDFGEVSHLRGSHSKSESNNGEKSRSSKMEETKKEKNSKSSESNNTKEADRKSKKDTPKDSRTRTNEPKSDTRGRTGSKEFDCERLLNYGRKYSEVMEKTRALNAKKKGSSNKKPAEGTEEKRKQSGAFNEASTGKTSNVPSQSTKENNNAPEPMTVKKEPVEPEDFVTTENDDYDPISDEELEALIEEPDDSLMKTEGSEEQKIVDALDINWSTLMNESKPELAPSKARNRFKAVHVLSKIGFSQSFAGSALTKKIIQFCQKQLEEEKDEERKEVSGVKKDANNENTASKEKPSNGQDASNDKKFAMEHPVAAFHVAITKKKRERREVFNRIGPSRRALCARQDLHIRKLLCRPVTNLVVQNNVCIQPYNGSDTDQCRQSPELKKIDCPAPLLNAAC